MKIKKIKKQGTKYKIILENNDSITTYDEVIINNNILYKKELNSNLLETIIKQNEYYEIYNKLVKNIKQKLRSETEIRKPPIPTIADKPVMGIKSEKNYITSNAIDNILMAPRKINNKEFDYLKKKDYGKVPEYLKKLKKEVEKEYIAIREMQRRMKKKKLKEKSFK
jgi:hypothetical protein